MKKQLVEYSKIVRNVMATEYAETMEIIRKEFATLDKMVFEEVGKSENKEIEETLETIGEMIENFKNSMFKMVEERIKAIIIEKKPYFVEKMTEISMECVNPLESIMIVEPLMKITALAYDTHTDMCMDYICKRLIQLMNAVEEKLGIREEMEEIENLMNDEELDIMKIIELIAKLG